MHVDINECTLGTHQCQEICHNTMGSYACSCNDGFVLGADRRSCEGRPIKTSCKQTHAVLSFVHNNIM